MNTFFLQLRKNKKIGKIFVWIICCSYLRVWLMIQGWPVVVPPPSEVPHAQFQPQRSFRRRPGRRQGPRQAGGAPPVRVDALDRIDAAIRLAEMNGAALLVIMMDTPGGFTKPTWSICKAILNSPVPVCTYIGPSGARAGSGSIGRPGCR